MLDVVEASLRSTAHPESRPVIVSHCSVVLLGKSRGSSKARRSCCLLRPDIFPTGALRDLHALWQDDETVSGVERGEDKHAGARQRAHSYSRPRPMSAPRSVHVDHRCYQTGERVETARPASGQSLRLTLA